MTNQTHQQEVPELVERAKAFDFHGTEWVELWDWMEDARKLLAALTQTIVGY